jgi:probable rRNA maturation factor
MNLAIINRQRTKKINLRLLRQITAALFAELKITEVELGITLVGAGEMTRVNWQFLRHSGSTDVITFDYSDPNPAGQPPSAGATPALYGELFICLDTAISQAKQFGTTGQSELVRYVVHGVLHLLGYDDLQPDLRRKMKRVENLLVRRLAARFSLAQLFQRG